MTSPFDRIRPRLRVISDNDYGGDPDGLVQLAHLLLSPSIEVPFVLSSHLAPLDGFDSSGRSAAAGAEAAARVAELAGRSEARIIAGTETGLESPTDPIESEAALAIVAEAMRTDTDLPLMVTCGGGLTEIASAWLIVPDIAERLTVVWIGGHEHDDLAEPPPGGTDMEYNTGIDPVAAQAVFNDSDLDVWQVPRDVYRMAIAPWSELMMRMDPAGRLGHHLVEKLDAVAGLVADHGMNLGETYVLGDNPLVLLTALWTGFEPGPASSSWVTMSCPRLLDSGLYQPRPDGRPLRVFTGIDQRMMLEDLYAKLALHAAASN